MRLETIERSDLCATIRDCLDTGRQGFFLHAPHHNPLPQLEEACHLLERNLFRMTTNDRRLLPYVEEEMNLRAKFTKLLPNKERSIWYINLEPFGDERIQRLIRETLENWLFLPDDCIFVLQTYPVQTLM